ncbi:MAG: hypothetical protein ACRES5_06035 [Pseudomonas sp.]
MSAVSDLNSDRPLVERFPSEPPGGRSAPPDADLTMEIQALAGLLAEVVTLAAKRAIFPRQWALIAELALEHESVRAALRSERTGPEPLNADLPALNTERIIGQVNQLPDLIGDGRARC